MCFSRRQGLGGSDVVMTNSSLDLSFCAHFHFFTANPKSFLEILVGGGANLSFCAQFSPEIHHFASLVVVRHLAPARRSDLLRWENDEILGYLLPLW